MSTLAVLPGSSAAPAKKASPGSLSKAAEVQSDSPSLPAAAPRLKTAGLSSAPLAALLRQVSFADAVSTFAPGVGGCGAAQASFNLGDTVCAEVSGPVSAARVLRRVQLINPAGFVVDSVDLTTNPQTVTFTFPSTPSYTLPIFDLFSPSGITIDNRGTWHINVTDTADASVRAFAPITVHDLAGAVADLQISKTLTGDSTATAGSNIQSLIWVFNYGPDTANNVSVTDVTPANTTFQSLTQTTGPTFDCTTPAVDGVGTSVCQPHNATKSLAKDEAAGFIVTYKVNSSITNGTDLNSTASISTATTQRATAVNTAVESVTASNPITPTCSLTCPNNITATADTVENVDVNGVPTPTHGTHVTFSVGQSGSTCGTVTASTPSGSFFPIGSTPVTATAADGSSCSFLVTVTSSGSPVTISCPASVTVNADASCQAAVTLGTPTTTGDNVTVTSSRSDGKALNAPFTSGVTTVTWTASNSSGTESCTQTVTVNDVTPPVINVPAQSASADANCQAAIPDLTGNPGITDNCACDSSDSAAACAGHPHISVAQDPAPGTLVGLGQHTITLTANDGSSNNNGAGNTTTAQVTFTVNDTTPPTIQAPPDATYQCASQVPDAASSQATAADNCGTVTVTVSENRSGAGSTSSPLVITRTYTATDASRNTASAAQTITVIDNTAPVPDVAPLPTITQECSVTVTAPTATDNCAPGTITATTSDPTSYSSQGTFTIHWTYTDAAGNTATQDQTVIVHDSTAPVPDVATLPTITGECSASIATAPTATDNCAGSVKGTTTDPLTYNTQGTFTVNWAFNDGHGNVSHQTQTVIVKDTTPPTLNAPNIVVGNDPGSCSAVVNYTGLSASDNCGTANITASPASGSTFPKGTTTVNVTVTDGHGNTTTGSFTVTVNDTQAPTINITGGSPVTVECHTGYADAGATATDNCDGPVSVATTSNNVDANTPGTYYVTYSAHDAANNTATATRTVNVVDTTPPTFTLNNLTIFFNNATIVFADHTVTVNGHVHPFNGVSFTDDDGRTFRFNGQTISVTINGHTYTYTLNGKTLALWTPTHQYQTVNVADLIAGVSDSCNTSLGLGNVVVTKVTSDEPEDIAGGADGNTLNDIVIGSDCKSVQLRAERNGSGNGRVYTITFRVRDASGNTTTATSKINIIANSFNVVDDGPIYTVNSSCQ